MKNNFLNRVDAESFRYAIQGLYSSKDSNTEFRELRKLVSKTENFGLSPELSVISNHSIVGQKTT